MTNRRAKKILDFLARRIGYIAVKPKHGRGSLYILTANNGYYSYFWSKSNVHQFAIVECKKTYKVFLNYLIHLSTNGHKITTFNSIEIIKPYSTLEELEIECDLNGHLAKDKA